MPDKDSGREAERALLGSMIVEQAAIPRALLHVREEDISGANHKKIFRALTLLYDFDKEKGIDVITVCETLRSMGEIDSVGGPGYIAGLQDSVVNADHVEHYARLVRDASLQRQIDSTLRSTFESATPENYHKLGGLIMSREGNGCPRIFDLRVDVKSALAQILDEKTKAIPTGFDHLDGVIVGGRPQELITIGGRPASGKTAFMTRVCLNMAQAGNECLYITSEMREVDIIQRIIPQALRIPAFKFRSHSLTDIEKARVLEEGAEILSTQPIRILARPRISLADIRRGIVQSGCKVVFIDYLQRCELPKADMESSALYRFMAELKEIMMSTNTVGFIGCQLDRKRDKEGQQKPVMGEFRGSGGIESESDIAMALWRPKFVMGKEPGAYVPPASGCSRIILSVLKSRGSSGGVSIDFDFSGEYVRFNEVGVSGGENDD